MKLEQLPSGSYRIRKTCKGKVYTIVFDHKPSQKEITMSLAEKMEESDDGNKIKGSFEDKALEYMDARRNVTSAATIGGYKKILRQMSPNFKSLNLYDIDQTIIQNEVNRYALGRAPKTVKNFYGLITAVMGYFRPKMALTVTLPQPKKYKPYLPNVEEVKAILESVEGTDYSIPFQLGALGMRRSEVCAADISDIYQEDGDYYLQIHNASVYDENNHLIIQNKNKTTESERDIFITDTLATEIFEKGYIFNKTPGNLLRVLHEKQDQLGIPRFRLHDMRHFYASYAHEKGMSDANIMESGGWKSDYALKQIYRHGLIKEKQKKQKQIANKIL